MKVSPSQKASRGFCNLEFMLFIIGIAIASTVTPTFISKFRTKGFSDGLSLYYGLGAGMLCATIPFLIAYIVTYPKRASTRIKVGDKMEIIHGKHKSTICTVKELSNLDDNIGVEIHVTTEVVALKLNICQVQKMEATNQKST